MDGQGNTSNDAAVAGHDYSLTRVNIHGTVDGLKLGDNVTVQDSYIHDLVDGQRFAQRRHAEHGSAPTS